MKEKILKGEVLGYNDIEDFAYSTEFSIEELGENVVGENFLIIKNSNVDLTVSFVLVGGANNQYQYECIYSDFN